jgi:hypothetical protein
MDREVVGVRTAADESDHPVRRRVNDVVDVAGVVALENADGNAFVGIAPRNALRAHRRRKDGQRRDDDQRTTDEWLHGEPPGQIKHRLVTDYNVTTSDD